ncbi:MAG: FAD-dependent oxidoreductase [Clostridia bacterium]|nr:FAD-dependent oxidoreductase [Clostridia bacterium]
MDNYIVEPQRKIPVTAEADLCVVGGSCTGVFAAVRAARMGLRVVLVERMNMLGGAATLGLVNIWHTLLDTDDRQQIIAGLTEEVLALLRVRGALTDRNNRSTSYNFNPSELAILLDELVKENKIQLKLHTSYAAVIAEGSVVQSIIIENKDGRQAIRAKFFIDASGDGFVARDLAIPSYTNEYIQPPTACFHLQGCMDGVKLGELVREHGSEFGLDDDWGWSTHVAGCEGITMRADQHIFGLRCDRADDLTAAEMEGRRQARAFVAMLQKYGRDDTNYALTNLCSSLGLRETVHYRTRFTASELPLLTGERYDAPIMNGTYPVDIHHASGGGISFKYLDGSRHTVWGKGTRTERGNWREELGITGEPAKFYQVPFDLLVGEEYANFIAAGRMLNADMSAYGALRVMVNLNQLGEAAGTAAALCLDSGTPLQALDGRRVTEALRKGGSAL